jgi:lysyl-tRNA synthetase class 2
LRLNKARSLRELGLDPFPSTTRRSAVIGPLTSQFEQWEGRQVTVAGRLVSWRKQGGMAFGHLRDQTGQIQMMLRRGALAGTDPVSGTLGYENLSLLDVGDIVEVSGAVGRSQRGEISVVADSFRLLTKALRPLPDKFAGLADRETILRKRYLDTISDPDVGRRYEAIARMIFAIRKFLDGQGFIEISTPVLQPQYGGGTAKPFRTHVNALGCDFYLSISHELYLKRLIAAGYEKVYTIGRYFRNEGIDRSHHPEFSMVETMTAFENYEYNMNLVEQMFRYVAVEAFGKSVFKVRGHEVDFSQPWRRVSMAEAVLEATGIDFREIDDVAGANRVLDDLGAKELQPTVGHALVRAFEEKVEKTLIQPTFVYGHPVEISPLAKGMAGDRRYVERFEIFIAGMECGDNWSEQNDPVELLNAWRAHYTPERAQAGEVHSLDFEFLECLEHGIPPTTGIGPGIERMAMIFTEQEDIYDVIFFPMMKPVVNDVNRQIYGIESTAAEMERSEASDSAIAADEFARLVRDGVLRPQTAEVRVSPFARTWKQGDSRAVTHFVELEGFLKAGRLILTGAKGDEVVTLLRQRFTSIAVRAGKIVDLE